ncbi:MAG: phosphate ABC transporter substrate-binding protein PstS [Actinomycetota bacterium]|nr:phosphate ABC transporter substrate-binding protein PstS [Actinomycetota bacterium]
MATGATASASAATLSGAGSTLVQPLEALWNSGWSTATGNSASYSGVGSGTGITDITKSLVDFGASDAPLNSAQQAACPNCVQIPWALSATAVGFHLTGITSLHLTGTVLAEIYLGQITKWNDKAIKKLNKGIKLPNRKITPIFRSDGSGDTYAFTNYLSHVSSTWSTKVGTATTVSFPTGVQAKGNSGMTAVLANTNGGIAYIAASYLIQQGGLGAVAIQNAAGKFEYPNVPNIASAASSVTSIPPNNAISIVDPPASATIAYPISTFTYVIVPNNTAKASLLQSFISYALTTGQAFGAKLDFAPIPSAVLSAATNTLNSLT